MNTALPTATLDEGPSRAAAQRLFDAFDVMPQTWLTCHLRRVERKVQHDLGRCLASLLAVLGDRPRASADKGVALAATCRAVSMSQRGSIMSLRNPLELLFAAIDAATEAERI